MLEELRYLKNTRRIVSLLVNETEINKAATVSEFVIEALLLANGEQFLSTDWTTGWISAAGTAFYYTKRQDGSVSLEADGPTNQEITLMVNSVPALFQAINWCEKTVFLSNRPTRLQLAYLIQRYAPGSFLLLSKSVC